MELVNIILGGGPYVLAAVMAFLFWAERTERKDIQERLDKMGLEYLERTITALNNTSNGSRDNASALQALNTTLQAWMLQRREGPL